MASLNGHSPYTRAFKFLAPDVLSSAILGVKGGNVKQVQDATHTKISIGSRQDTYPGTNSRLVLILGNDIAAIDKAMECIIEKLKSVVDEPNKSDADMSEIVAKKSSDVRLRIVIPKSVGGALIGQRGSKIEELRKSSGCRVRVEDGKIGTGDGMEQLVSLLGSIESFAGCISKINELLEEASGESWFGNWAQLNTHAGDRWHQSQDYEYDGYPTAEEATVLRIMRSIPRYLVEPRKFAMQTSLPLEYMSGIIGKGGHGIRDITTQSLANVALREDGHNTTVSMEGSMHSVLCSYMLVMKRYLELEQIQPSIGKGKSHDTSRESGGQEMKSTKLDQLKQRVAELQTEMEQL